MTEGPTKKPDPPDELDPTDAPEPLIVTAAEVDAIAASVSACGWMAFDVEFVSESRYIPELALLQVSFADMAAPTAAAPTAAAPTAAAIDFLAVGETGIRPILDLIESPDIETVAHAARQDLGLLQARYRVRARNLIDTQLLAVFAGLGEQIGYATLVRQLLGIKLNKSSQFTDWLKRPLSRDQLRYALDDVNYLPRVFAELSARVRAAGRDGWAREESQRMADAIKPPPAPEVAYLEVKGRRALRGTQMGSLRALADWRQRHAITENLPLSWVLPDRAMIDLCRTGAQTQRALRSVRGVGDGTVRKHGEEILRHIAEGARAEPPEIVDSDKPILSPRASVWATIVNKIAHASAIDMNLPVHLVAGKGDPEYLAAWFDSTPDAAEPDIPLLDGWRRTVAGETCLGWLRGDFPLAAGDGPGGLALPPPPDND